MELKELFDYLVVENCESSQYEYVFDKQFLR